MRRRNWLVTFFLVFSFFFLEGCVTERMVTPTVVIPDISGVRPVSVPDVIKEPQTEADLIINLQRLKEWGLNWRSYAEGLEKQIDSIRVMFSKEADK